MRTSSRILLAASLASALALPLMAAKSKPKDSKKEATEIVHCYGVNKCKGVGDCGGQGHSCKGENACKRQSFIDMNKDTCLKLDGGRLTPEPEKS
jgi:uncharacterized membrane protein